MTTHTPIDWSNVRQRLLNSEQAREAALHPSGEALRKVLRQRAEALAQPRVIATLQGQGEVQLLVFRLGADRFAIELADVGEVSPLRKCTPVPGGPAELAGVVCHRGEMRCVIDLARLLGRAGTEPTDQNDGRSRTGYLLHVRGHGGREVRLRVDSVDETLSVLPTDLVAAEADPGKPIGHFVKAIHRDGITVLSTDAVCAPAAFARTSSKGSQK